MKYTKETHEKEHDSKYNPIPDCEFCIKETYRRTHKCFGDGMSSVPIEIKDEK